METLKKYIWQLCAAILVGLLLYTAGTLVATKLSLKNSQKQVLRMTGDLDLARSEVNLCESARTKLRGALDAQNDAITDLGKETDSKMKAMRDAVVKAERESQNAKNRVKDLMKPAQGNSVCERLLEIDKRVLEDLNRE